MEGAEQAAATVEAAVERVEDSAAAAIDAANARAAAAENARDLIAEGAARDALHQEITALRAEVATWEAKSQDQSALISALDARLTEIQTTTLAQLAEIALSSQTPPLPPQPPKPGPKLEVEIPGDQSVGDQKEAKIEERKRKAARLL